MKNLLFIAALFLSIGTFAQSKKAEKQAKQTTEKMIKVLALESSSYDALYTIHKAKAEKLLSLDKSLSKQELKAKKKEIYSDVQNQMKDLLGLDTMKKWWAYKKENK